jgi:hypothetical protein
MVGMILLISSKKSILKTVLENIRLIRKISTMVKAMVHDEFSISVLWGLIDHGNLLLI